MHIEQRAIIKTKFEFNQIKEPVSCDNRLNTHPHELHGRNQHDPEERQDNYLS